MNPWLIPLLSLAGALFGAYIGGLLARRRSNDDSRSLEPLFERGERTAREEAANSRREAAELARSQRGELTGLLGGFGQQLHSQQDSLRTVVAERLDGFAAELRLQNQRLAETQQQFVAQAGSTREEQAQGLQRFGETQRAALAQLVETQTRQAETLRAVVEAGLLALRTENAEKLEQMRQTVDEKLHETLEKRLGESFKLVSERLEQVHKGLGEMQTLATGVGDLKRVLGNVKARGIFGEGQLGALLEQALTPEQYSANVAVRPGSNERVEFAIRLPGRAGDDVPMWLPIDAKFPREDYERLVEAQDRSDTEATKAAAAQLERAVRTQAKLMEKYVCPPHTTDFAVMFLPTEGLYAEVLRRPGLFEALQREYRVNVAGPTTLLAILNSLQMGFRTLAIEQRSSEVWQVLGAVKAEFGKFGEVLDKVKKKLDEASNHIEQTNVRSRAISRSLRDVEALPEGPGVPAIAPDGDAES
ncbi:DNA recombination protein RmuC [Solimonas sp. K1W22B-7]|uniref:DNA recombination protein RmuC n=1 Tax=Solimonas sp. K1W22B-7 TaxID=2303331 RepID=UPI000E32E709|nr:DNA recombination protein RmuC [Solimonas sp. K1W22B-7]AXQ27641.1 DNA recombination protein RmuC [Solimonas sp. K1W22B-7]